MLCKLSLAMYVNAFREDVIVWYSVLPKHIAGGKPVVDWHPIQRYPRVNCLKTIPFTAAHTYIAHIWQYPPLPRGVGKQAEVAIFIVSKNV